MHWAAWGVIGPMFALMSATATNAEVAGHCMLGNGPNGCATGRVTDASGLLKPGTHIYFSQPTDRYDHGVLGDAIEWGSLIWLQQASVDHGPYFLTEFQLPQSRVFEDFAPRIADLDGDGLPEIIVVETHINRGAQLALYALDGDHLKKIAATPYIGQTHRWLAPAGIGDFDGDGQTEIAYVDRPHLRRELVFLHYTPGKLTEIARVPGLTNHRIGDDHISGGTRNCGQGDELILADADWQNVISISLRDRSSRRLGSLNSDADFRHALACRN